MIRRVIHISACVCVLFSAAGMSVAQRPELVVQTGHSDCVYAIAFSPDGKTLASGSQDYTVKFWDTLTGAELRTLEGHFSEVHAVAFSPDGKTLASGSADRTIKLWDVLTGAELRTLKGHAEFVESVAFSPDGKTLASGADDNTVRLWEVATGKESRALKGHSSKVNWVVFSPDGKTLASCSKDSTIKLWDVSTGAEIRTLRGHSAAVGAVAFSPDGAVLASGAVDNTVRLWDTSTGAEIRTLTRRARFINAVAFSPDGKTLASGADDGTVKLWDVATGKELRTLRGHSGWSAAVAFSPDGLIVASGSIDNTIKLWDAATGAELYTLKRPTGLTRYSPSGLCQPGGFYNSNRMYNPVRMPSVSTGTELRTLLLLRRTSEANTVNFGGDGLSFTTCAGTNPKTWDIRYVTLSPDGKTIGTCFNGVMRLWDVATGAETLEIKGCVGSVAFSPDGRTIAGGYGNNAIKFWDVVTGAELRTLKATSSPFGNYIARSVTFSPDGRMLAGFGQHDRGITLWDISSGQVLRVLKGYVEDVKRVDDIESVAFSPDGKTIAGGNVSGAVKLWDVATGAELRPLKGHFHGVAHVLFSPDGRYLVSGSWESAGTSDIAIKVWEINSGEEVARVTFLNKDDWIAVTPDGLFDSSPGAWNSVLWRFNNNTFNYAPAEAFFSDFYYPDLLGDIFAGQRPRAPSDIAQKDRRQPRLKLTLAGSHLYSAVENLWVVEERTVAVTIDVSQAPAGAQDVRLFRNGSLVKVWHGDVLKGQKSATLAATIPITAGENRLTAYAFNHDNIKSADATLVVEGGDGLKRQGTAYVLSVGIDIYGNSQYNLKYAVADAEDFSTEFERQQNLLKNYSRVEVISLYDGEATKANILQALSKLAAEAQPEDAVIVYFSGHGVAQQQRFYLIPSDLGYTGPRKRLTATGLQTILRHGISDRELEEAFEKIDAGQLLTVIDACNSGQALDSEEKRRGPMNSKGLAQLAYEKGMYILAASQSYQAAWEAARLGHGFLTYALVEEGLKQGEADRAPGDGVIVLREWLDYATERVPQMQAEKMRQTSEARGRQGRELDLVFVEGDEKVKDPDERSLQRPRIFYRREVEFLPLIIAKTARGQQR